MRRAWQSDGTPSTSEDSLSYRRGSTSDPDLRPPARPRPLSDLYPLKAHVSVAVPPSLLSGCDAQVQPMTCDFNSEESRLNGFNTATWSSPVIGHPSRIMRLFSTQKKCTVPGDSQGSTRPLSFQGPPSSAGVPQVWPGLSGLTVMGSFKKLRSSVLQGIQKRGTANQHDEYTSAAIQSGDNVMVTTNQSPRLRCGKSYSVSNGVSIGQQMAGLSPYGSDNEDEEEVVDEEDGLQRNTWFSRSIRRAYGAGRISLLDAGEGKQGDDPGLGVSTNQRPGSGSGSVSEVNLHLEESVNENVNALSRLSKSADNLHLFKGPFRNKVPCPSPQTDSPGANGDPSIQRTASASSGDLRDRSQSPVCFRSPVGAKGHMLKLVGSITDLTVRRRPNPPPVTSPGSPVTPLSPLSRLHDDYSRRTPCLPASDRQRRPSPARTRAAAERNSTSVRLEHTPTIHPQPQSEYHPALFPIEPQEGPDHVFAFPSINQPFTTTSFSLSARAQRSSLCEGDRPQERQGDGWRARCDSTPHPQREPCGSHRKHQPDVNAEGKTEPKQCVWTRPDQDQEDQQPLSRPPVPSHQVPPYKAVSARFRPSTFSQSTPIGLDRLGRRKLHRVLSVEDAGSERSAAVDGDSVSEEEGSFDELSDVTTYLQPGVELSALSQWISQGQAVYAEALWDHVTMEEQELAFKAGDVIRVLEAPHKDWWWGMGADREAWFPSSFVRVRVNQEEDSGAESVESCALDQEDPHTDTRDTQTHSAEHREQMRTNVVKEIMNTERIYIKHLRDICEGYIRQCGKHPGMFTELQLKTIFSNIEDIYKFQRQFLKDLERKYNTDQPHLSEIGACFLLQGEGFSIYSEYCNTHPAACGELQRLMKLGRYKHFFEACRLLQQMIDISIAGFLLTPVQKICKYPLQLGELLKYTPKDHSDYGGVSDAYEAMKNVASLINEGKRRLESVDAIAHWQVAILRWEGADVLECSSELIHSGELTRIVRQGNKTQQRSFFLFDHQLVFCKKDVLRRDLLHYRGRLDMDNTSVLQMPDGRDPELGILLRNALRLRNSSTLETLCYLCCRKPQDRQRWLQAFARERQRVQEDQEMGMKISETQRKQAIFNARRSKRGKMKPIGYSGSVPPHHHHHHQPLHPIHQRHVTVPTSVPQQQVFTLAEPKRKPAHLWYTFTRHALFRK
ncbi:spermatogenesis-associated protein 13 isoform X3 [Oncorhynchus kisutch]|uniref:spermatogenesis-associated protein 13 isoform X3 n=1 Tax=Oncorhynchus kisutch TaxID=8019 RepID=UPI0012DF105D|nr:spermatogenesis-associated protein 13-like isoform X3 [Oncorhynchus kisutch]